MIDPEQLKQDIAINDVDLSSEMMGHASLYVHYAQILAKAQRAMDRAKITVELTESKVHDQLSRAAKMEGVKVTETALGKQIARDSRYLKAQMAYADAKTEHTLAKEALEAFKQRRDMLVQMGVWAREEFKGEVRLKAIEEEGKSARQRALDIVKASQTG